MALRRTALVLIAAAWLLVGAGRAPAQEAARAGKPLDVSYITDDFFAALVIQPARLMASPGLKGLPVEELSKGLKEQIGVEPGQVEQVILLAPREFSGSRVIRPGEAPPPMPLGFAGIVRFREAAVNKELLAKVGKALGFGELQQVDRAGKTYWKATGRTDLALYAPDERTLVFASERKLTSMVFSLAPGGRFVSLLRKADASGDVLVVADPSAIREQLAGLSRELDGEMRGGPEALIGGLALQLLRRVDAYTFSADFSQGSRLRWEITATSTEDAELLHDLIRGWQATLKLALPTLLSAMRDDGATGIEAEIQGIAGRVLTEVLSGIKTSRTDDRVVMQLETKGNHAELLALAAKAVAAARQEGPIVQSTNNLRQLALGMHNFHDTFNALPSHANYPEARDKEGKEARPLLSWRVHILPFIEGSDLYRQFRFDEPWDSDHNKKLIAKMPAVFKSPGLDLAEGKTCYLVPVGNDPRYGTMFPTGPTFANRGATARGLSLGAITDGTSNTVMILEAPPEKAVTWTKPDDWEVNVKDAKKGLFGARKGFLLAAFGDASAQRVSEKASAEAVLRLLGRADGEVVDFEGVILGRRSFHDHGGPVPAATKSIDVKSAPGKSAKKPVFDEEPSKAEPPKDFPKESAVPPVRKE